MNATWFRWSLVALLSSSGALAGRAADPLPEGPEGPAEREKPKRPDKDERTDKNRTKKPRIDPVLQEKREKAQALVRRAQELASMGRGDEALAALREALEVYPAYPLAYHEMGVTLAEQKDLPQAEVAFKKALELAPDFARAEQGLAEVLRRQKRYGEALDHYKKALAQAPKDVATWYGIAATLRAQKQTPEALWALRELVAAAENPLMPAVSEARKEIALLEKAGVIAKAWGADVEAPGDTGKPVATAPGALPRHAGDKAFAERRYLAALDQYQKQWKPKEPDATLAYKIGATFAVMNDQRQALIWWRLALQAEPGRELIARHMAIVVAQLRQTGKPAPGPGPAGGDAAAAIARAKEALRQGDPGTALYLAQGLDAPGASTVEAEARLRLGDFSRARAMFEEILSEDPEDRVAKGGLAEALLRMGQTGPAEKAIQAWVGVEGSEGGYKARPETFLVFRRGEVDARLLAPPEPEE